MADSILCAGNVYIDLLNTNGTKTGLRMTGNATEFMLSTEADIKEQVGRGKTTYGQVIATAVIPKPAKFKMTLNQLDRTNLALSNLGTDTVIAYTAETVSDEHMTAPALGTYAILAKGMYSIKTGADAPVIKELTTRDIASVADYNGTVTGTVKMTVTAGHGIGAGRTATVTIAGTTDYDHTDVTATYISATEFYITETYTSTKTGTMLRTFDATTDYTVDSNGGIIFVTAASDMVPDTEYHVTYKTNNATGYSVEAMNKPTIRMQCFLDGTNYVDGSNIFVMVYDCQVRPTSGVDFLKDDFSSLTLEGTLLTPTGQDYPYKIWKIDA